LHIGTNDNVMINLPFIGFHCVVISFSAIAFSVLFTVIIEKTLLPLEDLRVRLVSEHIDLSREVNVEEEDNKKASSLIWIMPVSIVSGVLLGFLLVPDSVIPVLGSLLTGSLVILLISIGISIGSNKGVFRYLKVLGFKVVYLSLAIFAGSLAGGFFSGFILKLPYHISVISASGMSYYSLTGAYMTQVFGIEAGTYGFVVNVMREFFTVLLLPLLVRISKGSPIASGASGDMDTMLAPITRFVGVELGLVSLITGIIVSVIVTLFLPIFCRLFS
ncbi:MAG: lysine exporter LysO family protein, partial [Eubacteriales bacterium]|nr:lysine exporter LysO family protein [Eubacteriales bacterium]